DVQALVVCVAVTAWITRPDVVAALLGVFAGDASRAAETQRAAVAGLAGRAVDAELGAQLARERFGRDHDACLDHDLVDRAVELHHQALDVGHALGDVDHQQGVGAAVEADAAARGQEAAALDPAARALRATAALHAVLALLGQQLGDVLGAAVVDRDVLGHHLGAFLDGDARVGLVLLVLGDLDLRSDPDDVAAAALVQALGLQHDVQRLVPRHVVQAQGHVADHRVGGDDVEVGLVGDQLQHRAHGDVLEVEGHRL